MKNKVSSVGDSIDSHEILMPPNVASPNHDVSVPDKIPDLLCHDCLPEKSRFPVLGDV